jgi:vancomycin permeability regulator SanA
MTKQPHRGFFAHAAKRLRGWTEAFGRFSGLALARGAAAFFALFSLANAYVAFGGRTADQNLWWIDTSFLPSTVGAGALSMCALVLLAFAIRPAMAGWRRLLTVIACLILVLMALQNVTEFYRAWGAGSFVPGIGVPLSFLIALISAGIGWAAVALRPAKKPLLDTVGAVLALALMAALFPLAQVGFFGSSDYRAKADAAVVFGARVFDSGALSPSLRDRVVTGVDLYRAGLVRKLIMSGGRGENGIDETLAMRDAAVKAGVPSSAIILDHTGLDTDATVRNTKRIFRREGLQRVLAVSQGYHLPRVKMAYLAEGWNVRTVPAREIEPIWKTPLFIAREIPGFWVYWVRSFLRDVQGDSVAHLV